MHASIVALALALPALAIQVTSPNQFTVWSSGTAQQLVSWSSVVTDPTSFSIVLVNQDRSVLPTNDIDLTDNVATSAGSVYVSYPSGTWPAGAAFQVNLVRSSTDFSTIYAQSNDFNITSSGSVSVSSSTGSTASNTGSTLSLGASNTASGAGGATPTLSGGASATGDSLPNTSPTKSAARGNSVQVGALVLALGFVGAVLA